MTVLLAVGTTAVVIAVLIRLDYILWRRNMAHARERAEEKRQYDLTAGDWQAGLRPAGPS